MALGTAIGAITFSGSIIAFSKPGHHERITYCFPGQHALNALIGLAIVALIVWLVMSNSDQAFWAIVTISLLIGFLLIIPIGGADMPVVVSMLNSYSVGQQLNGFTLSIPALIIGGACGFSGPSSATLCVRA